MRMANPLSSPIRILDAGIRTSSRIISTVEDPRIPILFSCFPMLRPGVPFSTTKIPVPLCAGSEVSVLAAMQRTSATSAWEINILVPVNTYSSPSLTAFVFRPETSDPALGSVRPKAMRFSPDASFGKYFAFCSSFPPNMMGMVPSSWTRRTTEVDAQTFAISSITRQRENNPISEPPYSSGKSAPKRAFSRRISTISQGNFASSSRRAAPGAICSFAMRATVSFSICCSSVSWYDMFTPFKIGFFRVIELPRLCSSISAPLLWKRLMMSISVCALVLNKKLLP